MRFAEFLVFGGNGPLTQTEAAVAGYSPKRARQEGSNYVIQNYLRCS